MPFSGTTPTRIRDLDQMSWQDFERFAIAVMRAVYARTGIDIVQTQLSKDGGRDGEAIVVLGRTDEAKFSFAFRLWLEVKKRARNIGIDDIGGHLLKALDGGVAKIDFVTNRAYTEEACKLVEHFASRTGLQCSRVTGAQLLALARESPVLRSKMGANVRSVRPRRSRPCVSLLCWFARTPFGIESDMPSEHITVAPCDPVFILIRLMTDEGPLPGPVTVKLRPKASDGPAIQPYNQSETVHLVGECDSARIAFIMWPVGEHTYNMSDIRVEIEGTECECRVECHGILTVRKGLLPTWIPRSREKIVEQFQRKLNLWQQGGSVYSVLLISIAGAGKTFLLSLFRQKWLKDQTREVFLDGEIDKSAHDVVSRILAELFPLSPHLTSPDLLDSLAVWLQEQGMSRGVAENFSQSYAQANSAVTRGLDSRTLGELLGILLIIGSRRQPLVLVFEDLHKTSSSVIPILLEAQRVARRSSSAHVLIVCTTRETHSGAPHKDNVVWYESLRELLSEEQTDVIEIRSLTEKDSATLIQKAIRGLGQRDCDAIIDQVGRTPFAIREALAFMSQSGISHYDPVISADVVLHPELLRSALKANMFSKATELRLSTFRSSQPEWIGDLLDAAACFGTHFRLDDCVSDHESYPPSDSLRNALAEAERLDIIRPATWSPNMLRFDHDLIRLACLHEMGHARQREVAGRLIAHMSHEGDLDLRARLSFQAGRLDDGYTHASALAVEMTRRQRFLDAAQAIVLAMLCTDTNSLDNFSYSISVRRHQIDDAVTYAAQCPLQPPITERPRRDRQMLGLILKYLDCISSVGGTSGPAAETAITEGRMLAEHLKDARAKAALNCIEGRVHFRSDDIAGAARLHEEAERFYGLEGVRDCAGARAENLLRLAIAYRQLGSLERSREILVGIADAHGSSYATLAVRVLSNLGATHFYSDWRQAGSFWRQALVAAEKLQDARLIVHCLVDLAQLNILEDRHDDAIKLLDRARQIADRHSLENSLLRINLNQSCIELIRGDFSSAIWRLTEAEQIGICHGIGRRLWRVRANMATALEASGEFVESYIKDMAVINSLPLLDSQPVTSEQCSPWARSRASLALGNLMLRCYRPAQKAHVMSALSAVQRTVADKVATGVTGEGAEVLPGLLYRHAKLIAGRQRFILTE